MKKIFLILLFITGLSAAQPQIPKLTRYAADLTNTLNRSELNNLNYALNKFDDSTSTQIVFLMIPSLEGYPIEMLTNEIAENNKIGRKGRDNGVLFLVAKNDRKMRIEVGYGLEGSLPDALASSIIRNEVAPYFRRGNYYGGIVSGLNSIMLAVKGEYTRDNIDEQENSPGGLGRIIFFIIIFIFLSIFGRRGGRGGLLGAIILGGMMGGGRSGGGFSSGGGFGGFSGGGGSFGGGGASGGW